MSSLKVITGFLVTLFNFQGPVLTVKSALSFYHISFGLSRAFLNFFNSFSLSLPPSTWQLDYYIKLFPFCQHFFRIFFNFLFLSLQGFFYENLLAFLFFILTCHCLFSTALLLYYFIFSLSMHFSYFLLFYQLKQYHN